MHKNIVERLESGGQASLAAYLKTRRMTETALELEEFLKLWAEVLSATNPQKAAKVKTVLGSLASLSSNMFDLYEFFEGMRVEELEEELEMRRPSPKS